MGVDMFIMQHLEHIESEINFAKVAFENRYNFITPPSKTKHEKGETTR